MKTLRLLFLLPALACLAACGPGSEAQDEFASFDETETAITASSRFETFTGKDGLHYFHLIAGNGERVLASEGYSTAASARNGIITVKNNGLIDRHYLLREATDGSWYFVIVGGNGQIVAVSEIYSAKSTAERAITRVQAIMEVVSGHQPAPVNDARFVFFRGLDGKYYFHVRAGNGEIVLQSQAYASSSGARNGAASVQTNGGILSRYLVKAAADGKYFFVLKAGNGAVIARGETYESQSNAQRAVADCAALLALNLPR